MKTNTITSHNHDLFRVAPEELIARLTEEADLRKSGPDTSRETGNALEKHGIAA